jgi:hypothetical protein
MTINVGDLVITNYYKKFLGVIVERPELDNIQNGFFKVYHINQDQICYVFYSEIKKLA